MQLLSPKIIIKRSELDANIILNVFLYFICKRISWDLTSIVNMFYTSSTQNPSMLLILSCTSHIIPNQFHYHWLSLIQGLNLLKGEQILQQFIKDIITADFRNLKMFSLPLLTSVSTCGKLRILETRTETGSKKLPTN